MNFLTCDDKTGQILRMPVENGSPVDVFLQPEPASFFDPELVSNVINAPRSWVSNIAGLTPKDYFDARYSAQPSGVIAAWDNLISGGSDAVQVAANQNPTLNASGFAADNGQMVTFTPTTPTDPKLLRCNAMATDLTVPYTLVSVVRHAVIDGQVKNIVAMTTGGGIQWYTQSTSSVVWLQNSLGATVTFSNTNAGLSTTRTSLHAVVINGANSYLWDNGVKQTGDLTLAGTYAPTICNIGAYGVAQNAFNGDVRSLIGFNGAATQSQLDSIFLGLCGQVPLKIVCEGDSLTQGVGGTPYPTQLATLMNDYSFVTNVGLGGDTLAGMITNFATNVLPQISASIRTNVVIWAGTNDIYFGANDLQTIARMWEFCDLCRANGARVTLCTMIPRSHFNATQESWRVNFNNAMAQDWRSHADGIVYLHKIVGLSAFDSTYWDPDNVHLNTNGYALVARAVSQACRKIGELAA